MPKRKLFKHVAGVKPGRSAFDLSHQVLLTADMGILYPTMVKEVYPGDFFEMGTQCVVRMLPMVTPIMHPINVFFHYFFVPNRILDENWEDFISGGENGEYAGSIPEWSPTTTPVAKNGVGSLWDYMGFPPGVVPNGALPCDYPRRAYAKIWNDYYRDENLQDEVALDNEDLLRRSWVKDYFTSALPWQQRGIAPALPISGTTSAVWDDNMFTTTIPTQYGQVTVDIGAVNKKLISSTAQGVANLKSFFGENTVDLSNATTFNVSDLRLAFQVQKWLERNARAGVRYCELIRAHFGVAPLDERLDRPEFIGGMKSPIIVSEVLQTSETSATSPQGNLAGHGIGADQQFCGKYKVKEHGIIMCLMSIMPKPLYQQGISREWLRKDRYDYYWPEFATLSEQAIQQAEIYATNDEAENQEIFGYQGRYDELRVSHSRVCGLMRTDFDMWHLSRQFSSAPLLNESFIQCNPRKDFLAAPTQPAFIITIGHLVKAVRPMPFIGTPGLIDHY